MFAPAGEDSKSEEVGASAEIVALVDFQCACEGPVMNDLSFLLLTSLPPSLRRSSLDAILKAYYAELTAGDKVDGKEYTYERCHADYELALPSGLMQSIASPSCFQHDDAALQVRL